MDQVKEDLPGSRRPAFCRERVRAWVAHFLTLSGLIWAALAMHALQSGQVKTMWLYLVLALVTDAADGPLARRFEVTQYAAQFDGGIADMVIDYLTWTFIPAYFLFSYGYLGGGPMRMALFVLILVSSVFCYANVSMKTEELYFAGFPAAWNLVALYFYLLHSPVWLNVVVTIFLSAITVVPITFLHPFRVRRLRVANVSATVVWLAATVFLVIASPSMPTLVAVVWWTSAAWIIASGLWGGMKGLRQSRQSIESEAATVDLL